MSRFKKISPKIKYDFLPAVYCFNKSYGHHIEYFIPSSNGSLTRYRLRINVQARKLPRSEFRVYVARLINEINSRFFLPSVSPSLSPPLPIASDTSAPLPETETKNETNRNKKGSRGSIFEPTVKMVFSQFIEEKKKDLRPDTLRSYSSFVSIFGKWLESVGVGLMEEVDSVVIGNFMHYVYCERNVSAIAFNNYVKVGRALLNWSCSRGYSSENPFTQITRKRTPKKQRTIIPKDDRALLLNYCNEKRSNYDIILMLVYSSLIRPKEIRLIQLKHIHIESHYIEIPADNAKNHNTRFATLSPELCIRLSALHLDRYPADYYLFGSHIEPSDTCAGKKCYGDFWDKMKKALQLPKSYKLYSLRDTGITEMLEAGIPDIKVMKHADHSSLEVTSIYASHRDNSLISDIFTQAPKF